MWAGCNSPIAHLGCQYVPRKKKSYHNQGTGWINCSEGSRQPLPASGVQVFFHISEDLKAGLLWAGHFKHSFHSAFLTLWNSPGTSCENKSLMTDTDLALDISFVVRRPKSAKNHPEENPTILTPVFLILRRCKTFVWVQTKGTDSFPGCSHQTIHSSTVANPSHFRSNSLSFFLVPWQ